MTDFIPSFLHNVIRARLAGVPAMVDAYAIESDGRRRDKAIRALLDEGLISATDHRDRYAINERKILETVTPVEPDLCDPRRWATTGSQDQVTGISWSGLSPAEQVWCITGGDTLRGTKYRWRRIDNYGCETYEPVTVGQVSPDAWHNSWLSIECDESVAAIAAANLARRVESSLRGNFQWALSKLGVLDADAAVKMSFDAGLSLIGLYGRQEADASPDEWGKRADVSVQRLRDQIAMATQQLEMLHELQKKVALYGGWQKFVADARAAITVEIKKNLP